MDQTHGLPVILHQRPHSLLGRGVLASTLTMIEHRQSTTCTTLSTLSLAEGVEGVRQPLEWVREKHKHSPLVKCASSVHLWNPNAYKHQSPSFLPSLFLCCRDCWYWMIYGYNGQSQACPVLRRKQIQYIHCCAQAGGASKQSMNSCIFY